MANRTPLSARGLWGLAVLAILCLVGGLVATWTTRAPRDRGVRLAPDNFAAANAKSLPFSVQDGFVAELVAGPPLVRHPMYACFDDRGRLYVAGSSGGNGSPDERKDDPPDWIRRLEDTDGDGRFDRSIMFADGMTYPQGVLWHDGAVYVASPPSLWRLEDTDGDGMADSREELLTGFAFTGIADDLHGPSVGPDGRLYFGVGRFPYEIRRPAGPVLRKGTSPFIMRCRTDGSEAEMVSSGMGNPVEVAFTPLGEPLACGTFFAPPEMGASTRDAIIHCVFGGVFPVRDRVHHEDKQTGEVLPPLVHLGVAAPSGLVCAQAKAGEKDPLVVYSALFNMHKVQSHRLERDGATFRSHNEDFVVSSAADFHPTDVLEDADGSLLVVDTGGWFKSCPTSQIDKTDTLGAIYRVRRRGTPASSDPRGLALDWDGGDLDHLAARLEDPRFAVRERAVAALVRRGDAAIPSLAKRVRHGKTTESRREAIWALSRIGTAAAAEAIRPALDDGDAGVQLVAATASGMIRDVDSVPRLIALAGSGNPALKREAATALGRIGRSDGVAALLEGLRATGDRFLEHAQIFALIQIGDRTVTLAGLSDPDARVRRGALIALDQMRGGNLTPDLVTPLVDTTDPLLRETAIRVVASRPEWSASVVEMVRPWLRQEHLTKCEKEIVQDVLPRIASDREVQDLVASGLQSNKTPVETRVLLLQGIAQARPQYFPRSWREALDVSLDDRDPRVLRQTAATIRSRSMIDYQPKLLALAADSSRSNELRIEALEAAAPHVRELDSKLFTFLQTRLRNNEPPLTRMAAARCLGTVTLNEEQLLALCSSISRSGSLVLMRLLPAYRNTKSKAVGKQLVAALGRAPGLRSLSAEALKETFEPYPDEVRLQLEPLLKRLDLRATEKKAVMASFSPVLGRGVPDRGREVFFGTKAACSACHSVRGIGGKVGPDLTGIGSVRNGRDLLEAVLFPSASFARGFEPYLVATHEGNTLTALIKQESAGAITFLTAAQEEVELRRSDIAVLRPSPESIMPRGLEANMSRDELADLLAFLGSLN